MDIFLSCKLLKAPYRVPCVIDCSGAFITKVTTAKVRGEGVRQNEISIFVLDCNRFSHGDCLNKQGDCVKTSPRGMCCVAIENGLTVRPTQCFTWLVLVSISETAMVAELQHFKNLELPSV